MRDESEKPSNPPATNAVADSAKEHLSVASAILGTAILALVGWAGWLSTKVVNLSENSSSQGAVLIKIENRVDRISEKLPTELALITQDILHRKIKSAIVVGEPIERAGKLYRVIGLFDGIEGKLSLGQVPVSDREAAPMISEAVLIAKNMSESAATIKQVEHLIMKYQVVSKTMPEFVDKEISLLSDLRSSEIRHILEKKAHWKQRKDVHDAILPINYSALVQSINNKKALYTALAGQ